MKTCYSCEKELNNLDLKQNSEFCLRCNLSCEKCLKEY